VAAAQRSGSADKQAGPLAGPVPPLWLTVPARPGQLPGLRRALREWMAQAGIDEQDATSVQVAVGEATSNAVEHAYVDAETGLVRLTARLDADEVLSVQVIDNGRWRPPGEHSKDRGRGFPLMRATMDEVDVLRQPDGTTVLMRLSLNHHALNHRAG
jgi:anti-sigma regulatory factor (Ser/Thr protein kinase)